MHIREYVLTYDSLSTPSLVIGLKSFLLLQKGSEVIEYIPFLNVFGPIKTQVCQVMWIIYLKLPPVLRTQPINQGPNFHQFIFYNDNMVNNDNNIMHVVFRKEIRLDILTSLRHLISSCGEEETGRAEIARNLFVSYLDPHPQGYILRKV